MFVIAHRLSTIRNSDAIIVLEHGKIIERGDHKDPIKQKGTYYQLYTGKLELSIKNITETEFPDNLEFCLFVYSVICEKKNGAICATINCIFIPDVVYCQQKEMGAQYVKIMDTGRRTGQR